LDEELWNNCSDNISLYGYFQTEKYFKHIDSTIREDFTFVDKIFHSCYYFLENTFGYSNCISLHIRRGDYLKYTHHPEQPMSYYETALTQFPELPVLVFSDDIEWCRQQELFKRERFYLSEGNGTAYDLCLQSLCQYHIIANSSFSWWGAWLADSQNVIAPRNWFGPPLSYNTKDLYLNHWTII